MTTPTTTATVRDDLIVYARRALTFPLMSVEEDIAALSPLPRRERNEAFDELCTRVYDLDRFERGDLDWSDVIPDATGVERDEQARDALETFVELALDRLTGGESRG
jgi:hypothetical protein